MSISLRSLVRLALAASCGLAASTAPASERDPVHSARVIVKYRSAAPSTGVPSPSVAQPAPYGAAGQAPMRALSAPRTTDGRPQHAQALGERMHLSLRNGRVLGHQMQALHGSGLSSEALAARLASQPDVEWAVPDMRRHAAALPNDPFLPAGQTTITPSVGQWYLRAPDSTQPAAINAVAAWDITRGNPAVTVAVLDTGVLLNHPDLASKLRPGYDFVATETVANDGDGRDADPGDPGDWTSANECGDGKAASASNWHGTKVAGLIGAATNNGIGMAGAGYDVSVLPVRVLGRCGGYDSDIIAAMRWAAGISSEVGTTTPRTVVNAYPARVINMSLGSAGTCLASWRSAIAELHAEGVTVVVAAGNDAGQAINTPANCPGALAVTGVRHAGTKVGYSNLGPEAAIAAPAGNCVNVTAGSPCLYPLLTTTNTGTTGPLNNTYSSGGSNATLGTSFSAPIVAGTVGLMLSVNPALSPERVRTLLQTSATPFPTSGAEDAATVQCRAPTRTDQLECYCTTATCGAGLLNAAGAVTSALAPAANINAPATVAVGASTVLSANESGAAVGRGIATYRWSLTSGSSLASFSGGTDRDTATLVTTAPGAVVVRLEVTDTLGVTAATSTTLQVAAPAATGGGGGGGGTADWSWLGLLAACGMAWRVSRRR
jgi:serine protease